ncbi:MAG: SDR family oxidoreductase [Pseudomonadales bacterium]|nr:SDR family oxidoreductase [Pseudomonadales bacterium]
MNSNNSDSKIIIITGANSGIGKATAVALAQQGATIIMACRDAQRANDALNEVIAASSNRTVEVMPLDLASIDSINTFAEQFQQKYDHLDILINNAGIVPIKKELTNDGLEMQIGVNHIGHFLLTKLLIPQLKAANQSRVVNVASMIHNIGKIDFDSFQGDKPYNTIKAYGQSKLANILFTRELAKRYASVGISTYSLHPGNVGTSIMGRGIIARTAYKILGGFMSHKRGARTSIYLATAPGIESLSGSYFNEFCKVKKGSKISRDLALAEQLWEESEKIVATSLAMA